MDGLVVVDKPSDWTSHDVVARSRRILRTRRVGHTGTLDPFATGVLVLLVGRATRLARFLAGAEKEYEAVVRLGYATDTGDLTGARREEVGAPGVSGDGVNCSSLTAEKLEAALSSLRGEIEQVPPMYSAKKIGGRKLYELARRGEEIEREAVRVTVREFEATRDESGALARPNEDGTCDVSVRVVCSAGTYVRSLAESLGETLGVGAHLAALRRTRAGAFRIERAVKLEELEALAAGDASREFLIPLESALPEMPFVHLTDEDARRVRHGAAVAVAHGAGEWEDGENARMLDASGTLLAVGVYDAERGRMQPRVMLAADEKLG